jgi:filamentous hemagglutinin
MERVGFHARLPRHGEALIPVAKVRDYLLNPDHPVGRSKAVFFARLGFARQRWELLERELRALIAREPAWAYPLGPHGQKFQVWGTIRGPWKRTAQISTHWIISIPASPPRLITAFPKSRP